MGEIRKRGGVWWIRYYVRGKRREESSRSTRKGAAVRLLALREGALAKGEPLPTPAAARLTVAEALDRVEQDYVLRQRRSLADTKRRAALHLRPYFGERLLASVTTADVAAYQAHRRAHGAAPATVNRETATLRRAFSLARRAGVIYAVPIFDALPEDNARQSFLDRAQVASIAAELAPPLRPVVWFAFLCGWRVRSEVLPLEWRQVDRGAGVIRIDAGRTKNGKPRVINYADCPPLRELIDGQWAERQRLAASGTLTPYVFHRSGKPIRDFLDAWRGACRRAGLPGKLIHDLRRSAVRNLTRAGVPQRTAMSITGHLTTNVFLRYDIVSEADQREAGAKLAAYLDPNAAERAAGTKQGQAGA